MSEAKVVIARGHQATPWELRPWELLPDRFDVSYLKTRSNGYDTSSLGLRAIPIRARRDLLPRGRFGDLAMSALGDGYLGLAQALEDADIVHSEELYPWFAAQPATLRARKSWKLVVTVWETIPMMETYRTKRSRRSRESVLETADLFLAMTERARAALLIEGVPAGRIEVTYPGIDVERFRSAANAEVNSPTEHLILSPARLVWEKGHQDTIRALAALHRGLAGESQRPRLLIVGAGPEGERLSEYARELEIADYVEIRSQVPYDEMPSLYARASCLVLASLASATNTLINRPPAVFWEEQFGMVLAEAMAAGLPIVASDSGAISEVAGSDASYFAAGDWVGLARELAAGPLSKPPGERVTHSKELIERYSIGAAAERLASAYDRLLSA